MTRPAARPPQPASASTLTHADLPGTVDVRGLRLISRGIDLLLCLAGCELGRMTDAPALTADGCLLDSAWLVCDRRVPVARVYDGAADLCIRRGLVVDLSDDLMDAPVYAITHAGHAAIGKVLAHRQDRRDGLDAAGPDPGKPPHPGPGSTRPTPRTRDGLTPLQRAQRRAGELQRLQDRRTGQARKGAA